PSRFYTGPNGDCTKRSFVDKQPIFLAPHSGDVVHFAYIDEGVLSTAGFETWLAHYTPLFRALQSFVVVYVAGSPAFLVPARQRFDAAFGPRLLAAEARASVHLAEYFRDRRSVEQRDFAALGRAGMERFRSAHQTLDSAAVSAMYRRWLVE